MLLIVVLVTLIVFAGALLERIIEPETFPTFGDALWFSLTTLSTTGYGDFTPVTAGGRAVASVLMVLSLALVPVVTSVVVSALVVRSQQRLEDRQAVDLDHGGRDTLA
jgi:voltage-gated potassium channel